MNDRKQHVINKSHQLFIEKGFQATSIQDIIDYSGISKGTFYNYFSSKNELLMALFTSLNRRMDEERNHLLVGQDPSDMEIFIQQLELHMSFNRKNKLLTLFEEVFVSNDPTLKQFLKHTQIMYLRWIYTRFIDLFGKSKQPYLLDCAIMFIGMLHHNIHFHFMANEQDANIKQVIRYTVQRIERMVNEVENNGVQLLEPEILEKWLPDCHKSKKTFKKKLDSSILALKKCLSNDPNQLKYLELLDFIQEEVIQSKTPRKFLIKCALFSLRENKQAFSRAELSNLELLVDEYFTKEDSN
ncbi:MAG: TetR/AcrR family transcriptional regulator [Bacillota bacterium]|nr:TetR/AcrR family transcriptional regulator [Bacillota bacterium]